MKTFGTLSYKEGYWWIKAEPHVVMRVKGIFPRINPNKYDVLTLRDSPETCRDLEWFLQRFPLEVQDMRRLKAGSRFYQKTLQELEAIAKPDYVPREFKMAEPARHYQATAVEQYLRRGGLLLGDEFGMGKSITALASLTVPDTLPALAVVESHMPDQWWGFSKRFLPDLRVHMINTMKPEKGKVLPASDLYIITYHKLAGWTSILREFIASLIFDECQQLRRSGSQKYEAAVAIRSRAKYAIGLSATPIFNYGGEIFNVLEVLLPGCLGSEAEFHSHWCVSQGQHWIVKDPVALGAHLREEHIFLRRTEEEVGMELPKAKSIPVDVEHDAAALARILDSNLATELANRILKGSFTEKGLAAREFDMKMRQATGIAKAPFVAAFVRMLVESGKKVVLCGWHREVYNIWHEHLAGIKVAMYTGSETPKKKNKSKAAFLADADVLILSLRSGAGLDGLEKVCHTVVFGELDWSAKIHDQVIGRPRRGDQKHQVVAYFMVSEDGSDPMMAQVLGLKKAQSAGIVDMEKEAAAMFTGDETARVKRLAEDYLARHSGAPEVVEASAEQPERHEIPLPPLEPLEPLEPMVADWAPHLTRNTPKEAQLSLL